MVSAAYPLGISLMNVTTCLLPFCANTTHRNSRTLRISHLGMQRDIVPRRQRLVCTQEGSATQRLVQFDAHTRTLVVEEQCPVLGARSAIVRPSGLPYSMLAHMRNSSDHVPRSRGSAPSRGPEIRRKCIRANGAEHRVASRYQRQDGNRAHRCIGRLRAAESGPSKRLATDVTTCRAR